MCSVRQVHFLTVIRSTAHKACWSVPRRKRRGARREAESRSEWRDAPRIEKRREERQRIKQWTDVAGTSSSGIGRRIREKRRERARGHLARAFTHILVYSTSIKYVIYIIYYSYGVETLRHNSTEPNQHVYKCDGS